MSADEIAKLVAEWRLQRSRYASAAVLGQIGTRLADALVACAKASEDSERLDWLECEIERENLRPNARSLFRRNMPITRAAIDAARKGARDE
jgi:hypothetical protein